MLGRKALGPLGSGGTRPGPAPPARPRHPLPGQLWAAPRGRGLGLGASSCLCVRLSVRLSEALAQVKARGQGCRAPSRWEPARLRPLGPVCPGRPRASRSAPLQGARGPGFSKLRSAGEEAGARRVRRAGAGNGSSRPRAPGLGSRTGQLTIHQRVKRDRREASSLFRRLGAQQELLKDNTAPGTIPRVWQGCPTGAQTPGPSAGGPRPSGRPRGGERRSRAEACRGAAIGASARREVVVPSPQESRLSEPFQSAHNKCARHRMHHLPPQIRALMGRQIAVCGGHSGAWCRAACLPASGTRV
ncbi:translation initiation factor IF-2-like [Balaenoptera musculus]|uniref:Translation initiation factor IF-2-like n=1 Tax=Balaenoptera musculus TaxID=9771 RepID=A0A8B8YYT7_BALMU|nr:translation initiation factor IF-2-like [Balaenoptera musculus]